MIKRKQLTKVLLYCGMLAFFQSNLYSQIQKGSDIDGEAADDWSGITVSMPDANTLAVGAPRNDGTGFEAGHTRIYEWNGSAWIQKGMDIDSEAAGDQSGQSVSMPDVNTVAIGAISNDGNGIDAGHVRIYEWNGSAWNQKGMDIDGEAAGDQSGQSVSMPDNNTVAVGANINDGNGTDAGHVRIYEWNGSAWVQKGSDIDGEAAGDQFGITLSMPDANTVAIAANLNDGNGTDAGHVRIYQWNGSAWIQKGIDIDGEAPGDQSGQSVSMPDANTVAIGTGFNDGNGNGAGHVRIYEWNGSNWAQKGLDIDGDPTDASGWSVSMPNANMIAIGAVITPTNPNGFQAGHVRVYTWNGSAWIQLGNDINGEAPDDFSGQSVSMPDANTVAIGAWLNDDNGNASGHVRIYSICATFNSISPFACNSYTSPSGNYTWTDSGTYMDTIPNTIGCDSVITVNLTIGANYGTDIITACDSYMWTDGNTYTTSTNSPTWTLTNTAGCDSVVTLDLTITNSNSGIDVITACDSYMWIDGNTYLASTNIPTWTLTNAAGCDSVVTLDLTIVNSTSGTDVVTTCDSYMWIDGNTYTNSTNAPTWTLTNAAGCDSVVMLDLTITNSTAGTDIITACDTYIWIDGNIYTTSTNSPTWTLTNAAGCDSVVTLDLTITNSTAGTEIITACDSYTWIDGIMYTTSTNTPTWTLINAAGCDSLVTLDLTITNSTSGTEMITSCDSYTWIDGNTYTFSTNTPTWTLTNSAGCDSLVTLDLTITNSTSGTEMITACDSYTWIDGNTYTSSTNTPTWTLTNATGCDSVVTLDLTITNSTTGTDIITACDSYTWIDGYTYLTSTNTTTWTLTNAAGCDSVVTLDLTITNSTSSADVITACDMYIWIDGNTYVASTNAPTWILTNAAGCDSTVTLNLTINPVDVSVTNLSPELIANALGATYQWLDCDNAMALISGETNQSFTASVNGNYAVEVTQSGCTDTSSCELVDNVGLLSIAYDSVVSVYPNPVKDYLRIKGLYYEVVGISIIDLCGNTVLELNEIVDVIDVSTLSIGCYFISLETHAGTSVLTWIKE